MRAAEIAAALGLISRSGHDWRCRCPKCGGKNLTLADGDGGVLAKCWNGCASSGIYTELRRLGLLDEPRSRRRIAHRIHCSEPAPIDLQAARRARQIEREIADILSRCVPIENTLAERYLESRGLTPPKTHDLLFNPDVTDWDAKMSRPAMIARVRGPDGQFNGCIHRTYLNDDGSRKAAMITPKMTFGSPAGGAVRLAPAVAGEWLGIAEGIETALAVQSATAMPCWAALSAANMVTLELPADASRILLCSDNDLNGTGQRAAAQCAQRLLAEGREVRVAMPPTPGSDFNDVLVERAPSLANEVRHVS